MELRTVRRGLVALAIAVTLGLAGVHPAAAAEPGWFERSLGWLADLWSAEEARSGGEGPLSVWALDSVDKGFGMDPNGGTVAGTTPPSSEDQ